ncbi:MAG: DHH family phosphoesterase [Promethearchaeota archaeon]
MENKVLNELIEYIDKKSILITSHAAVDIDALASCISFKYFIKNIANILNVDIFFLDISKTTLDFLKKFRKKFPNFDLAYKTDAIDIEYDVIIVIDTNNINQIYSLDKYNIFTYKGPIIFIDHHICSNDKLKESPNIINDKYTSCSEIILDFFIEKNIIPPKEICFLLLSGLLSDSGFFKFANNLTILRASKLLEYGTDYKEVVSLLMREVDLPEKIAKIKGAQRVKMLKINNWLIGITHVGSYEAEVANTLLNIGFDVAIVLSEKKKQYRITTRANQKVYDLTGLHLGKILEGLSQNYEVSGGGHYGAASINGKGKHEQILNLIIEEIKKILI